MFYFYKNNYYKKYKRKKLIWKYTMKQKLKIWNGMKMI